MHKNTLSTKKILCSICLNLLSYLFTTTDEELQDGNMPVKILFIVLCLIVFFLLIARLHYFCLIASERDILLLSAIHIAVILLLLCYFYWKIITITL